MKSRLNVGVVGMGRMGHVYANNLAQRVPNAKLVAVADTQAGVAESFANDNGIPKWYLDAHDLINDKDVAAVVVVAPTSKHGEIVIDAAQSGKAIFCEKPMSTSLEEAEEMLRVIAAKGVFFQAGFQRRFDPGYVAAKKKVDAGEIGTVVLFQSTSRDPFRPSLDYCDPKVSGGMIPDFGIHDFDLARMYMGEVKSVFAIGGALAYPELIPLKNIDNAVISMVFESGALGAVQLSLNGVFGYDIRAELWGTKGSLTIGYHRETPLLVMTKEGISYDVVPYFMQRFEKAYVAQIQNFVDSVLEDRQPAVTGADGVAAMRISLAANKSYELSRSVAISEIVAEPATKK
jgi:scyllo-inositol 2-dehydrogenase (NAD+)